MSLAANLLPLAVLIDAENLVLPTRHVLTPTDETTDDFTFLVPLYGHPRYFRNEAYLRRHKANTLLVVNVVEPVMEQFARERRDRGWRVCEVRVERTHSPMEMIEEGLRHVDTTYAIRLDADTWADEDIGRAVAAMHRAGADICSAKVLPPERRTTLAEHMQGVEYDVAMRGRHHRPWMTSGAITLARADALRRVMGHHSNYFYGEDIEVGKIAKCLGLSVRHLDFTVRTEIPSTFRQLFRQRQGWWCGSVRSTFVNFDKNLRFPIYWAYNLVLVWLLLSGKILSGAWHPQVVPAVLVLYTGLIVLCNWPVRSRWMVLFPYYTLAQVLVMPAFGVIRYCQLLHATGHIGRYRYPTFRLARWRRASAAAVPGAGRRGPDDERLAEA